MEYFVPCAGGVDLAAGAELVQNFLYCGPGVPGVHVCGYGAEYVFSLAELFKLKAQLAEKLAVSLHQLPVLALKTQGYGAEQALGHDGAALSFQPVKNYPLMGGVLVYQQQALVMLHQNVELHGLAQYPVFGDSGFFHTLNSFFHKFGLIYGLLCRNFRKFFTKIVFFVIFRLRLQHRRHVHSGLIGHLIGSQLRYRLGRRGLNLAFPVFLRAHAAVKILLGERLCAECGCRLCRCGESGPGLCLGFLFRRGSASQPVLTLECGQHSLIHKIKNPLFVGEFNLCLCRVDVHVHGGMAHFQIQYAGGVAPGQKAVFEGLLHSGLHKGGAEVAAVAVEELGAALAFGGGRGADKTGELHLPIVPTALEHIPGQLTAQK